MKSKASGILVVLFFGVVAQSEPVNITCMTTPATTSVVVYTTGEDVTVRVIHSNGLDSIPLSRSGVTPKDLASFQKKAAALQQLGEKYDIHLDSSQCTIGEQKTVSCNGSIDQTINGHKLSYLAFDTSDVMTVSQLFEEPLIQTAVNMLIELDGVTYGFGIDYAAGTCVDTSITQSGADKEAKAPKPPKLPRGPTTEI
jgi:hypothetical protein